METVIVINDEDKKEGYFTLSTSKKDVFLRICRRIGGEDKLIEKRCTGSEGKTAEWILKIPIKYISTNTFSIGKKKPGNPNPNFTKKG